MERRRVLLTAFEDQKFFGKLMAVLGKPGIPNTSRLVVEHIIANQEAFAAWIEGVSGVPVQFCYEVMPVDNRVDKRYDELVRGFEPDFIVSSGQGGPITHCRGVFVEGLAQNRLRVGGRSLVDEREDPDKGWEDGRFEEAARWAHKAVGSRYGMEVNYNRNGAGWMQCDWLAAEIMRGEVPGFFVHLPLANDWHDYMDFYLSYLLKENFSSGLVDVIVTKSQEFGYEQKAVWKELAMIPMLASLFPFLRKDKRFWALTGPLGYLVSKIPIFTVEQLAEAMVAVLAKGLEREFGGRG